MDREELHTLSLEELRHMAARWGVPRTLELARSEILRRLGAPAPEGRRGLRQRLAGLLGQVDRTIGRSLRRLARGGRDAPARIVSGPAGTVPLQAAPAAGAPGGGAGPGELVYHPPGGPSSRLSSLAAIHGPEWGTGAPDPGHLTEGRSQRPRLAPSGTGPHSEPFGMLDLEELPETYGVDEVEVMYKDPWWTFVWWEVTDGGIEAARNQLGPAAQSARLVLRCFTTQHDSGVPAREIRDVPLTWNHGRRYLDVSRPGALLRVAVGLLSREGYFAPIAHSSLLRLPSPQPGPTGALVDWLQVQPLRGRGEQRERLSVLGRIAAHMERSLRWRVAGSEESRGAETATYASPETRGPTSPGGSRV